MCLSGGTFADSGWSNPTNGIFPIRDRFQVIWIHATSHPTEMVNLETIRNGAAINLPRKAMGHNIAGGSRAANHSVAVVVAIAEPEPAAAHRFWHYL